MSAPIAGSIAPAGWPSNVDPAARRDEFCKAIVLYVGNRRLDEALTREELGQLEGLQRVLALRNGLIANCVRHCRQNAGADVTIAVLTLITFMADNNDGICRLSVARMAQVFGRSERTIYRCLRDLEGGGLIGVVRNGQKGLPNWYWPTVPAGLAEVGASIVWFVDALSDKPKARIFPAFVDPTSIPKPPPDTNLRGTPDTTVRGSALPPDTTVSPTPDNPCQHISLNKKDNTASPEKEAKPASRKRDAKPRTKLPRDWKPSSETIAWAKANFVATDKQVAVEAEKFLAYHYGRGNAMADWPAAWRTWWFNGFHKIPRRMGAVPDMGVGATAGEAELHASFERARLMDEEDARCRR